MEAIISVFTILLGHGSHVPGSSIRAVASQVIGVDEFSIRTTEGVVRLLQEVLRKGGSPGNTVFFRGGWKVW